MPLPHWLLVLVFSQMFLLFLSVVVVYTVQPILNLKWFNSYMHIHVPSLRCLLSDRCCQLFIKAIMLFSLDLKDAYLHIPIVKHHYCSYITLSWIIQSLSVEWMPFGLTMAKGFLLYLQTHTVPLPMQGLSRYYIVGLYAGPHLLKARWQESMNPFLSWITY